MSRRKVAVGEAGDGMAGALPVAGGAGLGQFVSARGLAWGLALGGGALGFLATGHAGQAAALQAAGRELAMLLRFMAVVKGGFALACVALSAWRLGFAAPPGIAAGYLAACALMPSGAGLIWGLADVIAGAAVFHTGLAALLVTAWVDREDAEDLVMASLPGRRHKGWAGRGGWALDGLAFGIIATRAVPMDAPLGRPRGAPRRHGTCMRCVLIA